MLSLNKTGLFLQVRLNSSRMPGKALMNLHGKPLILHVIERLFVIPADYKVILTSFESAQILRSILDKTGWEIFVGSSQNVLKRFVDAASYYNVDIVIRATGDNPLLSSEIALETIELFHKSKADLAYLSNIPYGSGVEVISKKALLIAYNNTITPYHLEHVTPYIYENRDKFKVVTARFHDDFISKDEIRITVDTREDYEKINFLIRELNDKTYPLTIQSIVKIWDILKFERFKRLLIIFNSENIESIKRAFLFYQELKDEFEIYVSFNNNNYEILDLFKEFELKFIEFSKVFDFIKKTGVFDRVIVDIGNSDLETMNLCKKLGPVISINDLGYGGQIPLINIVTTILVDNNLKFNFVFDNEEEEEEDKDLKNINKKDKIFFIHMGESNLLYSTKELVFALEELGYKFKLFRSNNIDNDIISNNVEIVKNNSNIMDLIKESSLVITTFSSLFFDCLKNGIPVIVITFSEFTARFLDYFEYPYKIKFKDSFVSITDIKNNIKLMIENLEKEDIFNSSIKIEQYYHKLVKKNIFNIYNITKTWQPSLILCPYCCNLKPELIHRNRNWNMFKCKKCELIFTIPLLDNSGLYNSDYFFEEYKNIYGKTYEEDRENIRKFAKRRLDNIKKYVKNGNLLDFGSGLGFFSEYAEENGFKTFSIDISEFAVKYIKEKLGLNGICADYSYLEKSTELYDVITSFYVIEHIKDFEKLIFLFYCHLNKGGCLALSTPNANGISIKNNFKEYIIKHPLDHYRIFSPKFLKDLLKKYNFKKIKIEITGIHFERFLKNKKLLENKILKKIVEFIACIFKLGDTFEIYAKKC